MRIAQVITRSDPIGGASMHLRGLCLALRERGHEPVVLVGGEGEFTEQLRALDLPYVSLRHLVRPISPLHDAWAVPELFAALRRLRPDLVSSHSTKAGLVARAAARLAGLPSVFTAHGWSFTDGTGGGRVYALAERLAARVTTRIITVSDHDRALALRRGIGPAERLVTIHNGMADAPGARSDPGAAPPRIVMVGRMERQKDHATLLRALGDCGALPWELDLVGDGPLRPALETQAARLGLGGRVRFLGSRRDVPEVLARGQVFVLATNWEGLPLSVIEAMRAGLPVVATAVGGTGELVAEGRTGFLVPRGDAGAMGSRLRSLLADPAQRRELGAAGRARYEEAFTFERMFAATLAIYEEAVRDRGR